MEVMQEVLISDVSRALLGGHTDSVALVVDNQSEFWWD